MRWTLSGSRANMAPLDQNPSGNHTYMKQPNRRVYIVEIYEVYIVQVIGFMQYVPLSAPINVIERTDGR